MNWVKNFREHKYLKDSKLSVWGQGWNLSSSGWQGVWGRANWRDRPIMLGESHHKALGGDKRPSGSEIVRTRASPAAELPQVWEGEKDIAMWGAKSQEPVLAQRPSLRTPKELLSVYQAPESADEIHCQQVSTSTRWEHGPSVQCSRSQWLHGLLILEGNCRHS